MIRPRIIPVLMLDGSKLVKTVNFEKPSYIGDPRNALKIFNEKEVDELCILNISSNRQITGPNYDLIKEMVSEGFMPISYGGGITSLDQVKKLFSLGIEKVIINSSAHDDLSIISEASKIYGDQSIITSLDIKRKQTLFGKEKNYSVFSNSGKEFKSNDLIGTIEKMISNGSGEILINNIDNDGTMSGMDNDIIKQIVSKVEVPIIACGGIGSLEHIKESLRETRVSAIAVGSLFVYHGKHKAVLINYPDSQTLEEIYTNLIV